jgi:hypothetical protein
MNYRRLFELHHNRKIKKEPNGRSYEIHHIDGDHYNNEPSNWLECTIQEHYDIHFSQGDYGACRKISKRMKLTPEENSALCSWLSTGERNGMFGKHHSEVTKKLISEKAKQRVGWNHSEETKLKISAITVGKTKHSEEVRKKMSENRKGKPSNCKGVPKRRYIHMPSGLIRTKQTFKLYYPELFSEIQPL